MCIVTKRYVQDIHRNTNYTSKLPLNKKDVKYTVVYSCSGKLYSKKNEWLLTKGNNMNGSNKIILKDKLDIKEFIIYNYKIKNR